MRRAVQLAPSAYLSSSAATAELVSAILPTTHLSLPVLSLDAALEKWSVDHNETPPSSAGAKREKNWNVIKTANAAKTMLDDAMDEVERVRLLAAMDKGSVRRCTLFPSRQWAYRWMTAL